MFGLAEATSPLVGFVCFVSFGFTAGEGQADERNKLVQGEEESC